MSNCYISNICHINILGKEIFFISWLYMGFRWKEQIGSETWIVNYEVVTNFICWILVTRKIHWENFSVKLWFYLSIKCFYAFWEWFLNFYELMVSRIFRVFLWWFLLTFSRCTVGTAVFSVWVIDKWCWGWGGLVNGMQKPILWLWFLGLVPIIKPKYLNSSNHNKKATVPQKRSQENF